MRERFRKISQVLFVPADPVLDVACFDVVLQKGGIDEYKSKISLLSALDYAFYHVYGNLIKLFREKKYLGFDGSLNFEAINNWMDEHTGKGPVQHTDVDQKKALFVTLFRWTLGAKNVVSSREAENDVRHMSLFFGATFAIIAIPALLAGGPAGWFVLGLGLVCLSVYVCSTYHQNRKKFDGLKSDLNKISEESEKSFKKGGDGLLFAGVIRKVKGENQGEHSTFKIDEPPVPGL